MFKTQIADDEVNDEEGDWEGVVNVPDSLFGLLPPRRLTKTSLFWIAKPPPKKVVRMSMIKIYDILQLLLILHIYIGDIWDKRSQPGDIWDKSSQPGDTYLGQKFATWWYLGQNLTQNWRLLSFPLHIVISMQDLKQNRFDVDDDD